MLSHCSDKNYLVNSFFSEPQLQNNQYKSYTGVDVKGWTFNKGIIVNNSGAWGYPTPYPCGNQVCSIQMMGSISQQFSVPKPGTYLLIIAFCGRNCCDKTGVANNVNIFLNNKQVDSIVNPKINIWDYKIIKLQLTDVRNTIDIRGTSDVDRSTAIQLLLTDDKKIATVEAESSHNNYMVYLIIVVILILLVAGSMYFYNYKK